MNWPNDKRAVVSKVEEEDVERGNYITYYTT